MKKLFLATVLVLVSILSFGQTSLNRILCDCHYDFYNCAPICKSNDTLVYITKYEIFNDNISKGYFEWHYEKTDIKNIPDSLKQQTEFESGRQVCELMNLYNLTEVTKTFKHGFINSWSWSTNSVDGINFKINYTNTNSKTIKYIDIYFIVKNPVGDICSLYNNGSNIGHLRCVGPLEQYDSGSWSWDAVYYTTGDASNLHFTKFVITYMDNTKYTLVKELAYKYYIWNN